MLRELVKLRRLTTGESDARAWYLQTHGAFAAIDG